MKYFRFSSLGFTLIEVLVIALISTLLFLIAYKFYKNYKEKSYLVEGIEYAQLCINSLIAYCLENEGKFFDISRFPNCSGEFEGTYGKLTVVAYSGICSSNGSLPEGYKIKVKSTATDAYIAICEIKNGNVKCYIDVSY